MEKEKLERVVDKIALEVVKHTEAIKNLVTLDEFDKKMDLVLDGQDKMMVILQRLDQERLFTFERVRRIEEEVAKIKAHLSIP